MVRRARRAILFPPNENLQRSSPGSCLATIPPGGPRCGRERPDEPTQRLRGRRRGARRGGLRAPPPGRRRAVLPREARLRHPRRGRRPLPHRPRLPLLPRGLALQGREDRRRGPALALPVSVNLFFASFANQTRRSRKGGFTACANVFSPIPVTP